MRFNDPTAVRLELDLVHGADVGSEVTVLGTVDKVESSFPRPRMQIVNLMVVDETGVIEATFFKQPWIAEQVHKGDVVALSGKVTFGYGFKQMKAPFHEVVGASGDAGYARVLPVHGVTEGFLPRGCDDRERRLGHVGDVCDFLPALLVAGRGLMTLGRALREVHFPARRPQPSGRARRLAYDELLMPAARAPSVASRPEPLGAFAPSRATWRPARVGRAPDRLALRATRPSSSSRRRPDPQPTCAMPPAS